MTTIETPPTIADLATALLVAVAKVRQVTVEELEAERAGGDLELASVEAVAAIGMLETQYGRKLARVEDLEPEQLTSVANVTDLLHRRWPSAAPAKRGS